MDLGGRIAALPGMDRLLPALEGLAPAYLVGGAVRDLLRGAGAVDLDVTVEGDAPAAALELAARLGGEARVHDRFATATLRAGELAVDLSTARRERYRHPGALPEVERAGIEEDLGRRDFTVNAMAAALAAPELGRLLDPHGGRRDLEAGTIRVLHRHSFVDDPTRMLRALRYEARLGFRMDPDGEAQARAAAGGGALATVSGPRVRDELLDLLAEPEMPAALARMRVLGIDRALDPALTADPERATSAALGAAQVGADPALAALAALVQPAPDALVPWLAGLGLPAGERERVAGAARSAARLAEALAGDPRPSVLRALLDPEPPEALALTLALGAAAQPVLAYVGGLRDVRLEIDGEDLVAAGVPPSPALGRALAGTLRRKLDGEVAGREAELRTALALARGEAQP